MGKVRIGFVGVGTMGQAAHLSNYATVPDCEVVAIAELREGLGKQVAARYGVARLYRTHSEMLASDPPPGDMDEDTYNSYLSFVNYYIHQVNLLGYPYVRYGAGRLRQGFGGWPA